MRARRSVGPAGTILVAVLLATGCSGGGSLHVELAANASGRGSPQAAGGAVPAPTPATSRLPDRASPFGATAVRTPRPRPPGTPWRSFGLRLGPVRPAAGPLCSGDGWEQRRGASMLARIGYPYWGLAFSVHFLPARAGYLGYTSYADRRIEVYVGPCSRESAAVLTHVIAHEIGHAVDYTLGDADRRARWEQERGIAPGTPWYGCSTCTDYRTPAGDFAETFAYWQAGPAGYRSAMAGPPSPAQLQGLAAFFRP